jgi:ATP-dependent Clp protease ATP-binding subunit ClpC
MSLWEPFTEPARHAIVRAQQVAQMFASTYIGTEHIAFALAEGDDELGRLLTNAVDRERLRELLGGARGFPKAEMVFTPGAKRTIELAFENARRLGPDYISASHLALGILASDDGIPLRPDTNVERLRAELETVAGTERDRKDAADDWEQTSGSADDPPPAMRALLASLHYFPELSQPGTRVTVSIEPAKGKTRTWTWEHQKTEES